MILGVEIIGCVTEMANRSRWAWSQVGNETRKLVPEAKASRELS